MAQNGYLATRIYTAGESFPVEGATVTVTEKNGDRQVLIAKRKTDENGRIPIITISAPNVDLSLSPGNADVFRLVDVRVDKPSYYTVIIKDVQIFGGQTTVAETALIPLIENSQPDKRADEFVETPQNL